MKWIHVVGRMMSVFSRNKTYTVTADHPQFDQIEKAVVAGDDEEFVKLADVPAAMTDYAKGAIRVTGGKIYYGRHEIHNTLTNRILDMMQKGIPFEPMVNFLERLMKNPSKRAIDELYSWLLHQDIPITTDGYWLGYKRVKADFTDCHTGAVDNHVGQSPEMPRSMVDDNWGVACSQGYHVGSMSYVSTFSASPENPIILVKVDPADVVSVPSDEVNKCRVAKYIVIGLYSKTMTWPVYDAPGPDQPIRPVAGITKDPQKVEVAPVSDTPIDDDRDEEVEEETKWEVRIILKGKKSPGIVEELDEYSIHNLEIHEHGAYDVLTTEFDTEQEADDYIGDIEDYAYVLTAVKREISEIDKRAEAEREAQNPHDLIHLTTQQRYELRQRVIESLIGDGMSRINAEVQVEGMNRHQMANSLPNDEARKYLDPDYEPDVNDLYPIEFDLFDGDICVGHYNVRTEQEESQVMQMARTVYGNAEQKNRVDHKVVHPE